jgi:flagellar biosynthesis protein
MAAADDGSQMPAPKQQAVALKYEAGKDEAPRITATGQGHIAEQILQIAFAHGVKVREDAPLVEILSMLEVDSLIPLEAYAAVAEILSYVYKANAQEARIRERHDAAAHGRTQDSVASVPDGPPIIDQ